jgi:hypothetical protein
MIERIVDGENETITSWLEPGLNDVVINIRRRSDGYYLDWNDSTFKNSGWTTQNDSMSEVGSTGQYEKIIPFSTITNLTANDNYVITVTSEISKYSPQLCEIKIGQWVDEIIDLLARYTINNVDRNIFGHITYLEKNLEKAAKQYKLTVTYDGIHEIEAKSEISE